MRTGPATRSAGRPTREQVDADLDLLDGAAAIEAWWWTGDLAADYGLPGLAGPVGRAGRRLSRGAGATPAGCWARRTGGWPWLSSVGSARGEHHHLHDQRATAGHAVDRCGSYIDPGPGGHARPAGRDCVS